MSKLPISNYLRMYRKRTCLTQDEVAFLLGCESGTTLTRYERQQRVPRLETIFELSVILSASVEDLYLGMLKEAEERVAERAKSLVTNLQSECACPISLRKWQVVDRLTRRQEDNSSPIESA